jgi:hypothetical protein
MGRRADSVVELLLLCPVAGLMLQMAAPPAETPCVRRSSLAFCSIVSMTSLEQKLSMLLSVELVVGVSTHVPAAGLSTVMPERRVLGLGLVAVLLVWCSSGDDRRLDVLVRPLALVCLAAVGHQVVAVQCSGGCCGCGCGCRRSGGRRGCCGCGCGCGWRRRARAAGRLAGWRARGRAPAQAANGARTWRAYWQRGNVAGVRVCVSRVFVSMLAAR